MRRLLRLLRILVVVHRYGLDQLALNGFRHPWARMLARWLALGRDLEVPRGVRLRLALQTLGPIFVKFGQMLSTRRDLLPLDIADELALLQDRVPPFDSEVAVSLIEKALGRPLHELFARFERTPVASASIAQVHFAEMPQEQGGQQVAVKVLRPGMLQIIDQDLALMRLLAGWVQRAWADGKRLKPREVVGEFDKYLHDELDLVREAANAAQLRRNMDGLGLVLIPQMVWDLCRPNVIVMERMRGIPISRIELLREAGVDIRKLAQSGVEIFFTQVFRDGFFHADMHPGNIMVSLDPQNFGWYIALDFGIIGTLSAFDKDYLAQNFIAFFQRDYRRVAELHLESGWVPADVRVEELEAAVRTVCEPQFERPLKDISLGQILMRLFQVSRRFKVEIQPQLVLLQKTLLNVEGLGRQLDPELDLWSTAQPFLRRWMRSQVGWPALRAQLRREAPRYARYLPELPRLLHQALEQAGGARERELQRRLLDEQRRTNALLQGLVAFGLGVLTVLLLLALSGPRHW